MKEWGEMLGYFGRHRSRLDGYQIGTDVFVVSRNPRASKRELSGTIIFIGKEER